MTEQVYTILYFLVLDIFDILVFDKYFHENHMRQSIEEWTKWNLCKTAFAYTDHITSNFLKAVFHKFHMVHSWILCSKWKNHGDRTWRWFALRFKGGSSCCGDGFTLCLFFLNWPEDGREKNACCKVGDRCSSNTIWRTSFFVFTALRTLLNLSFLTLITSSSTSSKRIGIKSVLLRDLARITSCNN